MTQRKAITLILTGAAVLLIATLSASAERTTDDLLEITTVSTDNENHEPLIEPYIEKVNEEEFEERQSDNYPDLPLVDEDLLISPTPNDYPDNLVSPEPGAEGDVFILEHDNLVRPDEDAEGDVFILDNEETPKNLVAPKDGAEGDVFILNDETMDKETKDQSFQMSTFPPVMIGIFLGFIALVFVLQKKKQ